MKKMIYKSFMLFMVLMMIMVPGVSARTDSGKTVDIIVLASGPTDALAEKSAH